MAERKILEAMTSFAIYLRDGTPFSVVTGDRFWSDDPAVAGREQLFGEVTVRSSLPRANTKAGPPPAAGDAETATAAPGSRRSLSRKGSTDA
jgi:hypothetical protein